MPLQAGDKGVQKLDSLVVGGATGTATVNIIVARRLWSNRVALANDGGLDGPDATGLPQIYEDSCLWLVCEADSTSSGVPELGITIANG